MTLCPPRDCRPPRLRPRRAGRGTGFVCLLSVATLAGGCDYIDTPNTFVVLDNRYPASAAAPLVAYQAQWQAVSFPSPVPPGSSSDPQSTVACSANTAWVVLAPGWDPTSSTPPGSFVVLESRQGFGASLNDTLRIPLDDTTFAGNCAAGSTLSQSQTDFITQTVFSGLFAGLHYDAATCTTTQVGEAGTE